jgi:hypothetical protein
VTVRSDGRIMIGGRFTAVAGVTRHSLARLPASDAAPQSLGVTSDRRTIVWARGGSAAEVSAVAFELSTDQLSWTPLGSGVPAGNAWTLGGQSLPANGVFYIRVRAIAPSSGGTASGVIQAVREFNFASAAFAPVIGAAAPAGGFTVHPFTGIVSGTLPAPGRAGSVAIVSDTGETIEIFAASPQLDGGDAQLANLSTRGRVTAGNPLILGFAVAGDEPRTLLVRAIGPALAGFGVAEALAGTRLQIHDSAGALIVANEGWTDGAEIVGAAARTGAFPLAAGSADSAALVTLAPGVYTMQVLDPRGAGGVALGEIYDAGSGDGSRLVNVSSRGEAGVGGAALISGFVITGDAAKRVLLRAVGPTLALFGAPNVVADPAIALFDSAGLPLGRNDNWVSHVPQIAAAARSAGAFALEPGSKDAAVIATLPPGVYTVQVSAGAAGAGTALLEVYELP